jgi:hypothetical protein
MNLSHSKNAISVLSSSQNFFLAIILSLFVGVAEASLSVSNYCQLTIDAMQQQITYMRELTALANQHQSEPQTLVQKEQQKRAEHDTSLQNLYASYQTTGDDYILYMGEHKRSVDAYLQAHPDVKTTMDNLAKEIQTLVEQYDGMKAISLGVEIKELFFDE